MKKLTIFIPLICFAFALSAQDFILYSETFNGPTHTIIVNSTEVGSATGTNSWIVNDQYSGAPTYADTYSEDSTVSGTINSAPYSNYLHIHDENVAPGITNANYAASNASDQFAEVGETFCTLGMTDIKFTFFWLGMGSSTASGKLYYSINGAPWVAYSATYSNQSKWKYEIVSDPAFNNVKELRFGFRWQNSSAASGGASSWAIDDILVVGSYDSIAPVGFTCFAPTPNPVCQNTIIRFNWSLSDTLCDGSYIIELSNASGTFTGAPTWGPVNIAYGTLSGTQAIVLPHSIPPGACYKIRMKRVSPPPVMTSEATICFAIVDCPDSIAVLQPVVLTDPDTCCSQSAIDIPFLSWGFYNTGNRYIAELIDSSGVVVGPQYIGELGSSDTYDPALPPPPLKPGTVSGLLPRVPAGCDYYIRIRSTSPAVYSEVFGPFCLKECDVTTNSTEDMQFCIWDTVGGGMCDSIDLDINSWDSLAHYADGNWFRLQLRDMKTFALVNDGLFYGVYDTASGTFVICVPYLDSLAMLGVAPGAYYARFVSDSSSVDNNQNGTIIRITIGAPSAFPPEIIMNDTVLCVGSSEIIIYTVDPYNPKSQYEWHSSSLSGSPILGVYPLRVNYSTAPQGIYQVAVREFNNGCWGPLSPESKLYIIPAPEVEIYGQDTICFGDTFCYEVTYFPETYYNWTVTGVADIKIISNNEVCVFGTNVGTFNLEIDALNECGARNNSRDIEVVSVISASLPDTVAVCAGDSVQLSVETDGIQRSITTEYTGNKSAHGNMVRVKALKNLTIQYVDFNVAGSPATVGINIYYRKGSYKTVENLSGYWTLIASASGITPNPSGSSTRFPFEIGLPLTAGELYTFYITTNDNVNKLMYSDNGLTDSLVKSDGYLDVYDGTSNVYPFGAFLEKKVWNGTLHYKTKEGLNYNWSNGMQGQIITLLPENDQHLSVMIQDSVGCAGLADLNIQVKPVPTVDAGPDSAVICEQLEYYMTGSSSSTLINWSPEIGLADPHSLTTQVLDKNNRVYYVQAIDPNSNCPAVDSIQVIWFDCENPFDVPQAFSPNGDGINDHFTVFGLNVLEYHIHIFNRWGEQVYESTDVSELNDLSRGWDGTYKGKVQELGTYVYYISGTDVYGASHELKGNLTLIQ